MRATIRKILWTVYRPRKAIKINQPVYYELRTLPKQRWHRILNGIFSSDYELKSNERVVELPFVLQNMTLKKGAKILDFGCTDSKLSVELASLGYKVTGTDLRDYELKHPNLTFINGDFGKNSFEKESFDAVVAISAVEHCGLSDYGEEKFEQGDYKIVKEMHRILKPKGNLIITVPFGKKMQATGYRIYNRESIYALLKDFKIKKEEYVVGENQKYWTPSTPEYLETIDSASKGFVQGVACIIAEK